MARKRQSRSQRAAASLQIRNRAKTEAKRLARWLVWSVLCFASIPLRGTLKGRRQSNGERHRRSGTADFCLHSEICRRLLNAGQLASLFNTGRLRPSSFRGR